MIVELGNRAPQECHHVTLPDGTSAHQHHPNPRLDGAPALTRIHIPDFVGGTDGTPQDELADGVLSDHQHAEGYSMEPGFDFEQLGRHLVTNPDVTRLPGAEAFLAIAHNNGAWAHHSGPVSPEFVKVYPEQSRPEKAAELERVIADWFSVDLAGEYPADFHDRYWRHYGGLSLPPGAHADPAGRLSMISKTNVAQDLLAVMVGGGIVGETGTATATAATTLTTNSGTSHVLNDLAGQHVVAWSNGATGMILSNTAGTNTVLTIDRWSDPANPGGAAMSTPSGTTGYTILSGGRPVRFMGLTTNSSAVLSTDTTLPGEYTVASGGYIRKLGVYAHTTSASSYTLTPVFTGNGSDTYPQAFAKAGSSQSLLSTVNNMFQDLFATVATMGASGDQLTCSSTVSQGT